MAQLTEQALKSPILPTWCPGCGNFAILAVVKRVLATLDLDEAHLAVVYGIGCGGNGADFSRAYALHALHGRAIANAVGISLANQQLRTLVLAGDGDLYGEGLNHFVAAARGNHHLTVIVHNNQMYSLTTGQSSPTTQKGTKTRSTPQGVVETEINPMAMAIAAGATFVSRAYAGLPKHFTAVLAQALAHPGFSVVDVLQPCPTFNKAQNYQWYQQRVYDVATSNHDATNQLKAIQLAFEVDKLPIGVLYQNQTALAYHQQVPQLQKSSLLAQFPGRVNLATAWHDFE